MKYLLLLSLLIMTNTQAQTDLELRVEDMESRLIRLERLHEGDVDTDPTDPIKNLKLFFNSASVQSLYFKCGNTLSLEVPGVDGNEDINYSATSATILRSANTASKVTIVPTGKTSIVTASIPGSGIKVAPLKFNVIQPPSPTLVLIVNGKEYNGMSPISKNSQLTVKVKAPAGFKALFPRDARYMFSHVDLLAQRSLGAPSKIGTYSGAGKNAERGIPVALGNKLKQDVPGTKVYLKINKLYRVNFQNKKLEVQLTDRQKALGFIIK